MGTPKTVGQLESALFERFPRDWAEPWDHVGLAVGDSRQEIARIAVALDATSRTVRAAAQAGANVLVTHHPVCLEMPTVLAPLESGASQASSCLWDAVRLGVALIAMHTNFDRSEEATSRLPRMLDLRPRCGIERGRSAAQGSLGSVADVQGGETLGGLARRCLDRFGRVAQVYGDPTAPVARAAFLTGSIGDCGEDALNAGADVAVCGECGYHRALDLAQRGLAVIILGHDASELPLADALAECIGDMGFGRDRCVRLDDGPAWFSVA